MSEAIAQDRDGTRLKVGSPVFVVGTVTAIEGSPAQITVTVDEDGDDSPRPIRVKPKQVIAQCEAKG